MNVSIIKLSSLFYLNTEFTPVNFTLSTAVILSHIFIDILCISKYFLISHVIYSLAHCFFGSALLNLSYLWISQVSFDIDFYFYCGKKTYFVWVKSFKIYWGIYYSLTYVLYVFEKTVYFTLAVNFYRTLLGLAGLYVDQVFCIFCQFVPSIVELNFAIVIAKCHIFNMPYLDSLA